MSSSPTAITATAAASARRAPKLANDTVLVIGGTSGIGLAVAAEALAQSARHVTVAGSSPDKLAAALAHLRGGGGGGVVDDEKEERSSRVSGFTCDLSDPSTMEENLRALLAATAAANGADAVTHVAFTAGDAVPLTPVAALSAAHARDGGTVRFVAPLVLAKVLTEPRGDRGGGGGSAPCYVAPGPASSLTLTGGVNSVRPAGPGWAVAAGYGAAVRGVARALAVELAPLRVNVVEPGAVETPLWGNRRDALRNLYTPRSTVGGVGTPADVAEAYVYLMKDRFAAGAVIESNGGTLLT